MANEATVLLGEASPEEYITYYTVADGTAIAKGSLMVLASTATRTATVHTGVTAENMPLGFAVSQKEANDGQVKMGVQRRGIVSAIAGATIDEGDLVQLYTGTANRIGPITTISHAADLKRIMGIALSAGAAGASITVRLMM